MARYSLILCIAVMTWPLFGQNSLTCDDLEFDYAVEVGEVKDQCATGTCWAHAATALMENSLIANQRDRTSLSEEFFYLESYIGKAALNIEEIGNIYLRSSAIELGYRRIEDGNNYLTALGYGAVPDTVLESEVISGSRNWFFNPRRAMAREVKNVIKDALKEARRSGDREIPDFVDRYNARLIEIKIRYQKRVKGSWRTDPDGQDRFEYKGKWYTPFEYFNQYVRQANQSLVNTFSEFTPAAEEAVINALSKGKSIYLALKWDSNYEFKWFEQNLGIRTGAHAVEITGVKLSPDKKSIISVRVKNSWGKDWKDGGFIDIPIEALRPAFNGAALFSLLIPANFFRFSLA